VRCAHRTTCPLHHSWDTTRDRAVGARAQAASTGQPTSRAARCSTSARSPSIAGGIEALRSSSGRGLIEAGQRRIFALLGARPGPPRRWRAARPRRAPAAASTRAALTPARPSRSSSSARARAGAWRSLHGQVAALPGMTADRQPGPRRFPGACTADGPAQAGAADVTAPRPSSPRRPLDGTSCSARSPVVATPSSRFPAGDCCRCSTRAAACRALLRAGGRWRRTHGLLARSAALQRIISRSADRPQQPAIVLVRGEAAREKSWLARPRTSCPSPGDAPGEGQLRGGSRTAVSPSFSATRGAFTGAIRRTQGRFELADGRHAVPRQTATSAPSARSRCCACAGARVRARRRHQDPEGRCPGHLRDQPRSGSAHCPGRFRADLYYRLKRDPRAADRCASVGRSAALCAHSLTKVAPSPGAKSSAWPTRPWHCSSATRGRATCASWRKKTCSRRGDLRRGSVIGSTRSATYAELRALNRRRCSFAGKVPRFWAEAVVLAAAVQVAPRQRWLSVDGVPDYYELAASAASASRTCARD